MVSLCVGCWRELPPGTTTCPACGADVEVLSKDRSYVEKLVAALDHPEPRTPVRAAWLLGELAAESAVPTLARIVRRTPDPYLAEAAVEALGKIADPRARSVLESAARTGALRVRRAAREAMRKLGR